MGSDGFTGQPLFSAKVFFFFPLFAVYSNSIFHWPQEKCHQPNQGGVERCISWAISQAYVNSISLEMKSLKGNVSVPTR